MFNTISANWAGQPLISYEMMLKFIRTSKDQTGFLCLPVRLEKIIRRNSRFRWLKTKSQLAPCTYFLNGLYGYNRKVQRRDRMADKTVQVF